MSTKKLSLIPIPLLLACLSPMPYGYYQLVRVVATAAFAFLAYQERGNGLLWVFVGFALLFQPFEKIALGRTVWNIVDVAVAVFLGWYGSRRR
jgi:hypothetical protein